MHSVEILHCFSGPIYLRKCFSTTAAKFKMWYRFPKRTMTPSPMLCYSHLDPSDTLELQYQRECGELVIWSRLANHKFFGGVSHSAAQIILFSPAYDPLLWRALLYVSAGDSTAQRAVFVSPAQIDQNSPYARDQKLALRSNHRYLEIDDHYGDTPVAGPSRHAHSISAPGPLRASNDGTDTPEGKETRYLRLLSDGKGISEWAWAGLVEQCQICENYFAAAALKKHIPTCKNTIIVL
ncbi:hypothetical protein C8J57DRAFT_1482582 [Mycena rebaudengoi]|nr:hypothetical protein C8J57DRAFT_1482582 [Mycena rebaudengoi]